MATTELTSASQTIFSESEFATLRAICDTFVPAIQAEDDPHRFYATSASDLKVPDLIAATVAQLPEEARAQLRQLLGLLDKPLVNLLFSGQFAHFRTLNQDQREAVLRSWAASGMQMRRQAFAALKRAAVVTYYAAVGEDGKNPAWKAINYPGPFSPPPSVPKPIKPTEITAATTLDCDVVVIGSGAGGGVVAGELAAAGKAVIVLEMGGYYNESDFIHYEGAGYQKLYLGGGALTTRDQGVTLVAGSCLGGGTVVNYCTSFRTPDDVREEWATKHKLPAFTTRDYDDSMDAISQRINVNRDQSKPSRHEELMSKGLEKLGWHVDRLPRDVRNCPQDHGCGYCMFGCQRSAKQSTLITYLQDAYQQGAKMIVNCRADRILIEQGQAVGVAATATTPSGERHALTVRAKVVVAAAGSLQTPALLLRSGLTNPAIGRYLRLHPATGVWGVLREDAEPFGGPLQALYSEQFANLQDGYGFRFEWVPIHPGTLSLSMPWTSGRQHKDVMRRYRHIVPLGILLRDHESGQVTIDKRGESIIDYRLAPYDRAHMRKGIEAATQVLEAINVEEIIAPSPQWISYRPGASGSRADFLRRVEATGYRPNYFGLITYHQMGSCRMGQDPQTSVINEHNEMHEARGLFVTDASAFPTATGVNPMLTIMSIAHRTAQYIKTVL
ncbi:MAG TPA: GMC family oxidoreductase N-terminal domain-containing protein [Ktedonobacterales bacterium]|jgi:choline dehydrogenase-like flavoprotein